MFLSDNELGETEVNKIPNLSLAYLGDSVFEIMVRSYLVTKMSYGHSELHKAALDYVSAPAQAAAAKKIMDALDDKGQPDYYAGTHGGNRGRLRQESISVQT